MWEQAFPDNAPLEERDWAALARLQLTGGGIRNIALSAAYHAAEKGCEKATESDPGLLEQILVGGVLLLIAVWVIAFAVAMIYDDLKRS